MASRIFLLSLCLAAFALAVFLPSLEHDFLLWEDGVHLYDHPHLASGAELEHFWQRSHAGLFIPLTYSAWSLLAQLAPMVDGGVLAPGAILSPVPFHAANLALHTVSVLLLFALIRRLLPSANPLAAAIGAAFFALHPLQVEAVAHASAMKDLLSANLALLALLVYAGPRRVLLAGEKDEDPGGAAGRKTEKASRRFVPSTLRYLATLVLFLLAVLAKPSLVVLPLLLAIIDLGFRRASLILSMSRLAPFALVSLAVVVMTVRVQAPFAIPFPPPEVSLIQRPLVAADAVVFYLSKVFYPVNLVPDYGRAPGDAFSLNEHLPLWAPFALLTILLLRSPRYRRPLLAAAALALFASLPFLGLVPFPSQGVSTVADRYCYLSFAGVALAFALIIHRWSNPWTYSIAATLAVLCAFASQAQLAHWRSTSDLFTRTLEVNPKSFVAHYHLGLVAAHHGRSESAIDHLRAATAFEPSFPQAYLNLGRLLKAKKSYAEAADALRKGFALDPGNPVPHHDLAVCLAAVGDFKESAIHFRHALELSPKDASIMTALATSLARDGQLHRSRAWFRNALAEDPGLAPAHTGLGMVYLKLQRPVEAAAALDKALQIARDTPGYPSEYLDQIEQVRARAASPPLNSNQ